MGEALALTMGEPAGIGGEITLLAFKALAATGPAFFLIDDPERVRALAVQMGADGPVVEIAGPEEVPAVFPRALPVLPVGISVPLAIGAATPSTAEAVLEAIRRAVALAMAGRAS